MNASEITRKFQEVWYEGRVTKVDCGILASEVTIEFVSSSKMTDMVRLVFYSCYKTEVNFEPMHSRPSNYEKTGSIHTNCDAHDYKIEEIYTDKKNDMGESVEFYEVVLDLFALSVKLWCKDIKVFKANQKNEMVEI